MTLFKILRAAAFLLGIWILVGFAMCFSSCRTTKVVATQSAVVQTVQDTFKVVHRDSSARSDSFSRFSSETVKLDTLPGSQSEIKLKPVDLQPVTDANGEKQGRTFRNDNGRSHASVDVDKDGNVHFRCKEDSLIYVIERMKKDSINVASVFARALSDSALESHSEIRDSTAVVTKTTKRSATFDRLKIGLLIAVLALLVGLRLLSRKVG